MQVMSFLHSALMAIFLLTCFQMKAQTDTVSGKGKEKEHPDSMYIRKYPDYLTIGLHTSAPIMEIRILPEEDSIGKFTNLYKGNYTSSLGFVFGYRGVNILAGFRTAPDPSSTVVKGQSSFKNFMVKVRWKAIYVTAYTSRYKGFYDNNTPSNYGTLPDSNQQYLIRPDIFYRHWMLSVTGNLTWKKYSYSGPYTYSERQVKSKAGFLLRASGGHIQIKGDSSLVHGTQYAYFSTFNNIEKINAFMVKGGPGVGFTIVIFKRMYISATAFIQASTVFYQYTSDDGAVTRLNTSISSFGEGSLALGVNSKRLFMGIHLNGNSNRIKLTDAKLETSIGSLSLDIGYRFNCPKGLRNLWAKTMTKYLKL